MLKRTTTIVLQHYPSKKYLDEIRKQHKEDVVFILNGKEFNL